MLLRFIREADPPLAPADPKAGQHYRSLAVPIGYTVDESGVWVDTEAGRQSVCLAPMLITARSEDIETGDKLVRVEWLDSGRWRSETVTRDEAMDARRIVRLARVGAPVSSVRGTQVVRWLESLEAENRARLPYEASSAHLGWSGPHFVLPESEGVTLRADEGTAQLAAAVSVSGSWDEWLRVVGAHVTWRPLLMLAVYAAACTPLLEVVGAPGFVLDWSGETSRGKTTALRCAAAVWGVPGDDGLVLKWSSASDAGPTTAAWFLQSIPLILDDTKQGRPDVIASMLYTIPGGQAKLKGSKDGGMRRTPTWRTCLLSTGEAPITSFNDHGGAMARTICVTGEPMGAETPENERAARELEAALLAHHGHLGRIVVEYVQRDGARERLRARHADYVARLTADATSAVSARMCRYVATLALAQEVVHHLGVPMWQVTDPIGLALAATQAGGDQSDRPREALVALVRWCAANQHRFWGRHALMNDGSPHVPGAGWAGRWDRPAGSWLCISPDIVRQLLDGWGYDVGNVLAAWDRREWTKEYAAKSGRRRRQVSVRVDGAKSWLVAFGPEVLAEVVGT
jgi:hypothetical protein